VAYAYNLLNQLMREDNEKMGKIICYIYDLGGNMAIRIVMSPPFYSMANSNG